MVKFITRFLEELVGDIHVDINSEEINDIRDSVNELLGRCLVTVEDATPYFKSTEVVPCGSMAEGTRIWKFSDDDMYAVLEFDFLAKLRAFMPTCFEAQTACGGFAEVRDNASCLPDRYNNEDCESGTLGKTNAKMVSFNFRLQMMKSVSDLCSCYELDNKSRVVKGVEVVSIGFIRKTKKYDATCTKCQIRKPTGTLTFATSFDFHPVEQNCTVVFLWNRCSDRNLDMPCVLSRQKQEINKEFVILIDFLPTIELYHDHFDTADPENLSLSEVQECSVPELRQQCFLVPKCCKNDHNTCWKVSHCLFEIQLLKSTSQVHRQCYMVLKFIFDYLLSDMGKIRGGPTTYVLKTAVLYHIQSCSRDTPELTMCTISIIEYLSDAHMKSHLPHLVLKDQNFLTASSITRGFRFTQEHNKWSENRNIVLAQFWSFLLKAFDLMETITDSKYNFDSIQTAIKLITTKYGSAYNNTTFKVVHLPDKEEFLGVLGKIFRHEDVSREEFHGVTKVVGDVDDDWEKKLTPKEFIDAYTLYAQMQHDRPDIVTEGAERAAAASGKVQTIYSRTGS